MTCPVCSAKVGAHRAAELVEVLRVHRDAYPDRFVYFGERAVHVPGGAVLVTLTLRHSVGMALVMLLTVLTYAWSRVSSGKAYQVEADTFGVIGWIKALEINWNRANWWHPHLHILVMTDVPLSLDMARELGERWFMRWERALGRRGIESIMDSGGLDVRVCDLSDMSTGAIGDYLSKLGHEVTRADAKDGRRGGFSTMGLLAEVVTTYEVQAFAAWRELESTLEDRRTRFVSWSKGAAALRVRAGLAAKEASDEEVAATDMGGDDVIAIDRGSWSRLRTRVEVLLRVAEDDGVPAAAAWLTRNGIGWSWVTPAPRLERPVRPAQRAPRPSRPPGRARSTRRP